MSNTDSAGQGPVSAVLNSDAAFTAGSRLHKPSPHIFLPAEQSQIKQSWRKIMRWAKVLNKDDASVVQATTKVVVFGGGSFGTAMGAALARQKHDLNVTLLLRDPHVCHDINSLHRNCRYLEVRAIRLLSDTH